MKIFIVVQADETGFEIDKAFDSEKKALDYIDEISFKHLAIYYFIKTMEVE